VRNTRAYLFRVATNLTTDYLKVTARRATLLQENHEDIREAIDALTPERITMARHEMARLRQAVAGLPPLSRHVFYLSRFEGKSHRQIAAALGVSTTTVEAHIRRVLDRLQQARGGG
jgi:RNA polymerase sigma factor (sigma-70 family)